MENLNFIIGKNLQYLRKKNKFTQSELGEKLNYSDKAVSKWEKGESLPPIDVFYKISKLYNVSIDSIVGEEKLKTAAIETKDMRKRYLHITLLSILAVWLVALILFVSFDIFAHISTWMCFAWAVPVSFVVGIVFDAIWNKCKFLFWFVSFLVWTLLLCLAVQLLSFNIWKILLIGIPLQIAVIIWSKMVKK
ncbi:MAG: helix-turn-helix transcriptional regulator [Ruminococcaceae bacterium]|nr:helix-turn-helix transcriptional regulator [Oscillospiraceae bacterium]